MEEEESIDFGELSHDENFKHRIISFRKDLTVASNMIEDFLTRFNYDELSLEDKVRPLYIKLSGASLIYHHFGERILETILGPTCDPKLIKKLFSYVYENFIQEVDIIDNGIQMYEGEPRYDLFLAFALNSYFWMYLRLRGIDPNEHEIKGQINRVREYMNKSKKIYEKNTQMPRIDQDAAKRFVKSGLWMPQNSKASESNSSNSETEVPAKRMKNSDE